MNPAFQTQVDGEWRHLVNTREGLRLNLTERLGETIALAIDQQASNTSDRYDRAAVDYLRRLRVLVEPAHASTAAEGISQASVAPIGKSWLAELRELARWVVIGCGAAFSPTSFGNPASGMLPVRRGVQKLLRPEQLWSYDTDTDLGFGSAFALDYGDIIYRPSVDRAVDVHDRLRFATRQVVEAGGKPLLIGGDHSLSHPVITELAQSVPGLRVVHFDAHADRRLLDAPDSNSTVPDCGNFVEHLLHELPNLPILTIGVRGWDVSHLNSGSQYQYIAAADVVRGAGVAELEKFTRGYPVYITTDVDVLDPSVAPEVAYASPSGLTLHHLQDLIATAARCAATVVGADFVEVCDWNTGRNLAAMAQVCAIATLLESDRAERCMNSSMEGTS